MYETIGHIGVPSLLIYGGCVPVGSSFKYSGCLIKSLSPSSMSLFVTFDTMLLIGSFFSLVYGLLVRCSLHFLM